MLQGTAPLDLSSLGKRYHSGSLRPSQTVTGILQRIARRGDDPTWIHLLPREALEARAAELERADPKTLPLYGIPFAIKDNIDILLSQKTKEIDLVRVRSNRIRYFVNVSAGVVYAMLVRLGRPETAAAIIRTMLRAEAAKIAVIVLQLWLILTTYREVVHGAFIAAFVVTVLVSQAAILIRD